MNIQMQKLQVLEADSLTESGISLFALTNMEKNVLSRFLVTLSDIQFEPCIFYGTTKIQNRWRY